MKFNVKFNKRVSDESMQSKPVKLLSLARCCSKKKHSLFIVSGMAFCSVHITTFLKLSFSSPLSENKKVLSATMLPLLYDSMWRFCLYNLSFQFHWTKSGTYMNEQRSKKGEMNFSIAKCWYESWILETSFHRSLLTEHASFSHNTLRYGDTSIIL